VALILLGLVTNKVIAIEIIVKDDDNKGVKSFITLEYNQVKSDHGPTDDDGMMPDVEPCKRGYKFHALPESPDYFSSKKYCLPTTEQLVLKVTKKVYLLGLVESAEKFERNKETGNASLVYAEIAARLSNIDSDDINDKTINIARQKSLSYFVDASKIMERKDALYRDEQQGKVVMSENFSLKLKEWQVSRGISATGVVDYPSISSVSNQSITKSIRAPNMVIRNASVNNEISKIHKRLAVSW
jgi:hypothetical protein